jgi:hypothetical protein
LVTKKVENLFEKQPKVVPPSTLEAKKIREAVGLPTPPTWGQEPGYSKPDVTVPLPAFIAVSEFEA